MSFVIDTSALFFATATRQNAAGRLRRRLRQETVHAPHLVDAELGNVLRRHVLRGDLPPELAATVLRHAPALVDHRHDHTGKLAAAAWNLRENLTFYDGFYVALAAALDLPLVTADDRLAGAPNLPCSIETPLDRDSTSRGLTVTRSAKAEGSSTRRGS